MIRTLAPVTFAITLIANPIAFHTGTLVLVDTAGVVPFLDFATAAFSHGGGLLWFYVVARSVSKQEGALDCNILILAYVISGDHPESFFLSVHGDTEPWMVHHFTSRVTESSGARYLVLTPAYTISASMQKIIQDREGLKIMIVEGMEPYNISLYLRDSCPV